MLGKRAALFFVAVSPRKNGKAVSHVNFRELSLPSVPQLRDAALET